LAVAFWLLRFVYKDQDISAMIRRLQYVDFQWIIYSFVFAISSHILRAYRWNLLLEPMGYKLKTFRTFLAVMVGYFANLIIPRAGEISRCGVLKKTDNVNMTSSIGTVVAERVVDFIMLVSVVMIAFAVEFHLLNRYLSGFMENSILQLSRNIFLIYIIIGVLVFILVVGYIVVKKHRSSIRNNALYLKIRHFMRELVEGITSIKKLENRTGFIVSSLFIWIFYYLMSYVAFHAIPETSELGFVAGLSILAMSSLGMLAPVQGGIGAYHALVTGVLTFYGINETDGAFFAGLLHSSQVFMVLVVGGISFFVSIWIKRRDSKNEIQIVPQ
jgi:glycosyltransferase 2 family protein